MAKYKHLPPKRIWCNYVGLYHGSKLGPQNAAYLFLFKIICVISAILACELLAYILVGPLRLFSLFLINLCGILVEVMACFIIGTSKFMHAAVTQQLLTLNMFRNLLKKIYIAFKNISLTGRAKIKIKMVVVRLQILSNWPIFVWLSKKSASLFCSHSLRMDFSIYFILWK